MSKSVVYYSHTYYDMNGFFDAIKSLKCDARNVPSDK